MAGVHRVDASILHRAFGCGVCLQAEFEMLAARRQEETIADSVAKRDKSNDESRGAPRPDRQKSLADAGDKANK